MAEKVKVWFDAEADYLDVQVREGAGYMQETAHNAVMERVRAAAGHRVVSWASAGVCVST